MSPVLLKFSHFSFAFNFYFYEKMCIFVASEGKINRTMIHFNIYMENFAWFLLFKYVSSLWDIGDIPVSPMWGPRGPFTPAIYEIMDSSQNMASSTSGPWLSAFLHLEVRRHHLQVHFLGDSQGEASRLGLPNLEEDTLRRVEGRRALLSSQLCAPGTSLDFHGNTGSGDTLYQMIYSNF